MTIGDYDAVLALWRRTEGLSINETDSREATAAFLRRNPRMSQVACAPERIAGEGKRISGERKQSVGKGTRTSGDGERIVGAVLCGSDGRRGMLYHLAVSKRHRGHGLGRQLVEAALVRLRASGCKRCHLAVLKDNKGGRAFWSALGWESLNGWVDFMAMWME